MSKVLKSLWGRIASFASSDAASSGSGTVLSEPKLPLSFTDPQDGGESFETAPGYGRSSRKRKGSYGRGHAEDVPQETVTESSQSARGGSKTICCWGLEAVSPEGANKYAPSSLSDGHEPPPGAAECPALELDLRDYLRTEDCRVPDTIYNFIVMVMALYASGKVQHGDTVYWRNASGVKVNATDRNNKKMGITHTEALKSVLSQISSRGAVGSRGAVACVIDIICFAVPHATPKRYRHLSERVFTNIGSGHLLVYLFHPMVWNRTRELQETIRVLEETMRVVGRDGDALNVSIEDFNGYGAFDKIPPEETWGFVGQVDGTFYETRQDCFEATGGEVVCCAHIRW